MEKNHNKISTFVLFISMFIYIGMPYITYAGTNGASSGNSAANTVYCAGNTTASSTQDNNPSSNADQPSSNKTLASGSANGISVDPQTGQVHIGFTQSLPGINSDMGASIGISNGFNPFQDSSSKSESVYGMPDGWNFTIPFIKELTQNGSSKLELYMNGQPSEILTNIVNSPKDINMNKFVSGLAYDFSEDSIFVNNAGTIDNCSYQYELKNYQGENFYFSASGNLVCMSDRYKDSAGSHTNFITYQYSNVNNTPANTLLTGITDSYGNKIGIDVVNKGTNYSNVTITMPDQEKTIYDINCSTPAQHILTVTFPDGKKEIITENYNNNSNHSTTTVQSPNGNNDTYSYAPIIPYGGSDGGLLYAVQTVTHSGIGFETTDTNYNYSIISANDNTCDYFGNPLQGSLSQLSDPNNLLALQISEINNPFAENYSYGTEITEEDSHNNPLAKEDIYYDFMHYENSEASYIYTNGQWEETASKQYVYCGENQNTYQFEAVDGNSEQNITNPEYSLPRIVFSAVYINSVPIVSAQQYSYDEFGEAIEIDNFNNDSIYQGNYGFAIKSGAVPYLTSSTQYYTKFNPYTNEYSGYGLVKSAVSKDSSGDLMPSISNELDKSGTNTEYSTTTYGTSSETTQTEYDANGRLLTNSLLSGPNTSATVYETSSTTHNLNGNILTIETTTPDNPSSKNPQDAVKGETVDVSSGRIMSQYTEGSDASYKNSCSYEYSNNGETVFKTYSDGSWVESDSSIPNQETTTSSNGIIELKKYDGNGNLLSEYNNIAIDSDGSLYYSTTANKCIETCTYNALGQLVTTTSPSGNVTTYSGYNSLGKPSEISVKDSLGDILSDLTSTYQVSRGALDSYGDNYAYSVTTSTGNSLGNIKLNEIFVNDENKTVESEDITGNTSKIAEYNGIGQITSTKTFNNTSEPTSNTPFTTETSNYVYSLLGDISYTTQTGDGLSYTATNTYDNLGNITNTEVDYSPLSNAACGINIGCGKLISGTSTFNSLGEKIKYVNPANQTISYTYYPFGKIEDTNDYAGNDYHYTYVNIGGSWEESTLSITSASTGNVTTYNYNYDTMAKSPSYGNLLSVTLSKNGNEISRDSVSYTYNSLGLESSKTMNGKTMYAGYTLLNGSPVLNTLTDYKGVKAAYSYCSQGADEGQIKSITSPYGSVSYEYYGQNSSEQGICPTNDYLLYDGSKTAQVTTINNQDNTTQTVNYNYYDIKSSNSDALSQNSLRLQSVLTSVSPTTQTTDSTQSPETYGDYYFYKNGMLSSEIKNSSSGNGINSNSENDYTYNDLGELLSDNVYFNNTDNPTNKSQNPVRTTNYTYDDNSNVLQKIVTQYETTNNVSSAATASQLNYEYAYDGNSCISDSSATPYRLTMNRLTSEEVFNNNNAAKANSLIDSYSYKYDTNGNMTNEILTQNNNADQTVTQRLTYNAENEMTRYQNSASNVDMSYDYNALTLRSLKYDTNNPSDYMMFFYAKNNVINEIDSKGDMSSNFGSMRLVFPADQTTPSINQFLVSDGKNIVSSISNNGSKTTTDNYNYSAYGAKTDYNNIDTPNSMAAKNSNSTGENLETAALDINNNPTQYSYYYYDQESGLYYCNARYYSPQMMHFTSLDTIYFPNQYAYCNGNPVMNSDPSGHDAIDDFETEFEECGEIFLNFATFAEGGMINDLVDEGETVGRIVMGTGVVGEGLAAASICTTGQTSKDLMYGSYAAGGLGLLGGLGYAARNSVVDQSIRRLPNIDQASVINAIAISDNNSYIAAITTESYNAKVINISDGHTEVRIAGVPTAQFNLSVKSPEGDILEPTSMYQKGWWSISKDEATTKKDFALMHLEDDPFTDYATRKNISTTKMQEIKGNFSDLLLKNDSAYSSNGLSSGFSNDLSEMFSGINIKKVYKFNSADELSKVINAANASLNPKYFVGSKDQNCWSFSTAFNKECINNNIELLAF